MSDVVFVNPGDLAGTSPSMLQGQSGIVAGDPADLALARSAQFRGGLPPRVLRRVRDYVEKHLEGDVSLRELAGMAGLSISHFGRAFKQSNGMTPHRYLMHCRVRRALSLLTETELPLSEVAMASGFADQSHFCRQFRKLVGATPSRYRWSTR